MLSRLQFKEINLYEAYSTRPKKDKSDSRKGVLIAVPIAITIVIAAVFGGISYNISGAKKQLAAVKGYIENSDNVTLASRANELEKTARAANAEKNQLKSTDDALATLPKFDADKWNAIYAAAGKCTVGDISYKESDGTFTVDATSTAVGDAALFTQKLRETGLFEAVSYTGYKSDSALVYSFTVQGLLKGGAAE